jgi:cytochrome c oxidase cbb3-type subunit III
VRRTLLLLACLGVSCLLTVAAPAAAQTKPVSPPSDMASGRRIFDAQCAWCHGNEGDGGTGPNLHGRLRHATTLNSIVDIVVNGIPGTDMPSFRVGLTERSAKQAAAYVLSLSRSASRPGPGNAERGAMVYQANGCGSCHVVEGRGGILGPELTAIGGRRGSAYLREAVVTPAASHPPGYLVVRAVPAGGPEIRGIRVNEDVFWIHIRDAGGIVHALQKSELTRIDRELDATLMPSYQSRLDARQLEDLVAYLATLRGAK